MIKEILKQALLDSQKGRTLVSFKDISRFPDIVQKYLQCSIAEGHEAIFYAKLIHGGEFRTSPTQPWFPIRGYYHYLTYEPSFYWKGVIKPLPILAISAKDFYFRGKGEMRVKLNSLIPIVKTSGPEIDQASLMRYVSEAPLFPSVFLTADFISWEEIDDISVKIFIEDSGVKAEGIFFFNDKGDVVKYESVRARDTKEGPIMTKWTGYFKDYKDFEAFKVPTYFIAEWNLPEGNFQYVKFRVDSIIYNKI